MDATSLPRKRPSSRLPELDTYVDEAVIAHWARRRSLEEAQRAMDGEPAMHALVGRAQDAIEDVLLCDDAEDVPAPLVEALELAHGSIMAYWHGCEQEDG